MTELKNVLVLALVVVLVILNPPPAHAQLKTPVTISTITCSAGTCTVTTSAAHSIPLNDPGFCILSSSVTADNLCGTASTVPTTTTFTVVSASMAACSSSCGTAQPAPVFMIQSSKPQFGQLSVTACMYVFVSAGVPISGGTSACSAQFTGALQTELNAAIAAGSWVEYDQTTPFSNSSTLATVEQYYQALQYSYQLQQLAPGGFSAHECDVTGCN